MPTCRASRSVVTTTGTTSFRLLREADKGRSLEVNNVAGKDHTDSFLMVEAGRADEDDPRFKALVDRVVGGMMKSGEMEKLNNKWFMSPIPPNGI